MNLELTSKGMSMMPLLSMEKVGLEKECQTFIHHCLLVEMSSNFNLRGSCSQCQPVNNKLPV